MKKLYYFLVVLFMAVGLGSCSSDENEETLTDKYELTFQVINYELISLSNNTRATTPTKAPHFVMAIYDARTNKLVEEPTIHKSGSAEGGTFSARLPKGEYNFVFLAYYTDRTLFPEDPTAVHWDAQVVDNTYQKNLALSIDEDTEPQHDIVLSRAVGLFTLNTKGTPVPQNFDHFRVQMQGGSYQLNALTGFAGEDVTRDYAFLSKNDMAGNAEISQSAYAFLPQEECTADITMIAEDKNNREIRKRTFRKVPMKINQMTRYTGDFFGETELDNDFSVRIATEEWETADLEF